MEKLKSNNFIGIQNKLWDYYQIIYFIAMGSIMFKTYLSITMFRKAYSIVWFTTIIETIADTLIPIIIAINVIFIFLSQLNLVDEHFKWSFLEGLIAIFVCGTLLAVHIYHKQYSEPLWFATLIIGAHNIDYKRLLKVYFWITVVFCGATFFCGITGLIENLVYYRYSGERRIAFGFTYPTDCCSHLFFLCVIWTFIRNKKITLFEIAIFVFVALFSLIFCNARTTFITLLLLSLWISWTKVKPKLQKKDEYYMPKIVRIICYLSGAIASGIMIALSLLYNSNSKFFLLVNRFLSDRIRLSNIGFSKYEITFLGQSVKMNGYGGSTNLVKEYFFLDSSYINALLRYGIATLIIILGIVLFLMLCENNKKNYMLIGVLFIVVLQCTIEQHIMEIGHTPLLLLLFTSGYSFSNLANNKRTVKYEKNTNG